MAYPNQWKPARSDGAPSPLSLALKPLESAEGGRSGTEALGPRVDPFTRFSPLLADPIPVGETYPASWADWRREVLALHARNTP